jgi:hypothetical protein
VNSKGSVLLKVVRALLIVTALGLLVLQFIPVLIDRRSVGNAVVEWRQNPTLQTRATMEEELRRNDHLVLETRIEILVLFAVDIAVITLVSSRIARKTSH